MSEAVDKVLNHIESPITRFRKLFPTLDHIYTSYPVATESFDWILSFSLINYFATLLSKATLRLKNDVLDPYLPFVNGIYQSIDETVLNLVFIGGIDKYFKFLKSTHLSDLNPFSLFKRARQVATAWVKHLTNEIKPTVVSVTNPVVSPINKTFENVMDVYLPKKKTDAPISNATDAVIPESAKDDVELKKFADLTTEAINRLGPLAQEKYEIISKYPGHIQAIYKQEYTEFNSIPKAVTYTGSEVINELGESLGFKLKQSNGTGSATSQAQDVLNDITGKPIISKADESTEGNNITTNGQISVGA